MKSMLSGLDLSTPVPRPDDGPVTVRSIYQLHADNLRTALVAALAVIDYGTQTVPVSLATSDPEGHLQSLRDGLGELMYKLETALEPFKVAGDDTEEGAK
jgi:hypothetical protein